MAEHERPGTLVVSPDRGIRIMLRRVLLDHGFAVEQASDGEALLRFLQTSQSAQIVLLERNTLRGRLPLIPPSVLYLLMHLRDRALPRVGWSRTWRLLAQNADLLERHAFILVTEREKALSKKIIRIIDARHIPIITYPLHNAQVLEAVFKAQAHLSP
jgi:hypothetical protein